jgi:hypothetical protein
LKIVSDNISFIYNHNNDDNYLENNFGLSLTNRLLVCELGLIASENNLEFSIGTNNNNKVPTFISYGKKGIIFHINQNTPRQAVNVLVFTKIGSELSTLIEQKFNKSYLEKICSHFKTDNVNIVYGDIIDLENGQIRLANPVTYTNQVQV